MFVLQKFELLQGLNLHNYMEPLLAQQSIDVDAGAIRQLSSNLLNYDEFHLVYALELCGRVEPSTVVGYLPRLLLHPEDSVFCAALNVLNSLPEEHVTKNLLDNLRIASSHNCWRKFATASLDRIAERLNGSRNNN